MYYYYYYRFTPALIYHCYCSIQRIYSSLAFSFILIYLFFSFFFHSRVIGLLQLYTRLYHGANLGYVRKKGGMVFFFKKKGILE